MKVQQKLLPLSTLVPPDAVIAPEELHASESLTLVYKTERVPGTCKFHKLPCVPDHKRISLPLDCPFKLMFCSVVVAPAAKATFTPAVKIVNVAVVDALAVKVVVAVLFVIERLKNAEVPVDTPCTNCGTMPSNVVVPELCVNVERLR